MADDSGFINIACRIYKDKYMADDDSKGGRGRGRGRTVSDNKKDKSEKKPRSKSRTRSMFQRKKSIVPEA